MVAHVKKVLKTRTRLVVIFPRLPTLILCLGEMLSLVLTILKMHRSGVPKGDGWVRTPTLLKCDPRNFSKNVIKFFKQGTSPGLKGKFEMRGFEGGCPKSFLGLSP